MHQQIDSSVFLKFTVNAIVSSREPGVCVQQWLDRLILKTDHRILRRRLGCKPKAVDGIQAGLAELVLNQIPVNIILNSGYLKRGIGVVRENISMGIGVCFLVHDSARQHHSCRFLHQLPVIPIAVDGKMQQVKVV